MSQGDKSNSVYTCFYHTTFNIFVLPDSVITDSVITDSCIPLFLMPKSVIPGSPSTALGGRDSMVGEKDGMDVLGRPLRPFWPLTKGQTED